MVCNTCGKEIVDGSKFCPYCGGKVETAPVCRNCGQKLTEGAVFCPYCGTKIDNAGPALQPNAQPNNAYQGNNGTFVQQNAAPQNAANAYNPVPNGGMPYAENQGKAQIVPALGSPSSWMKKRAPLFSILALIMAVLYAATILIRHFSAFNGLPMRITTIVFFVAWLVLAVLAIIFAVREKKCGIRVKKPVILLAVSAFLVVAAIAGNIILSVDLLNKIPEKPQSSAPYSSTAPSQKPSSSSPSSQPDAGSAGNLGGQAADGEYLLVTGADTDMSYQFACDMQEVLGDKLGMSIVPAYTSLYEYDTNIILVTYGDAAMGITTVDVLHDAIYGEGVFEGATHENLRAMCRIYPVSIVAYTFDDTVQSFSDMKGCRVLVGKKGGEIDRMAQLIFEAEGVKPSDYDIIYDEDIDPVEAVLCGEVEIAFKMVPLGHELDGAGEAALAVVPYKSKTVEYIQTNNRCWSGQCAFTDSYGREIAAPSTDAVLFCDENFYIPEFSMAASLHEFSEEFSRCSDLAFWLENLDYMGTAYLPYHEMEYNYYYNQGIRPFYQLEEAR